VPAELLDDPPRLERRPGAPVHAQIERWLTDVIARGDLVAGQRLPGERDLAAALRVSRMTLRQALDGLGRRGVLVRLPGRSGGAFVAEPKIDYDLTGSAGFAEQMRLAGRRAEATVLVARTAGADQTVAAALRLAPGDPVHELVPACSTCRWSGRYGRCSASTSGWPRRARWSTWSRRRPTRTTPRRWTCPPAPR
jgi:GntR family transcriptional regulator